MVKPTVNPGPFKPKKADLDPGRLLVIAGLALLATAMLVLKGRGAGDTDSGQFPVVEQIPTPVSQLSPEVQFDQHLAAGRPVLAFFHSNTCAQCIQMTEIVAQVYPDYADRVALVDVNVHDQRNEHFLGRAGIQVIPTLILIDRDQQGQGYAGVMLPETLRERLEALAQEP